MHAPALDPWAAPSESSFPPQDEREWLAELAGAVIAHNCPTSVLSQLSAHDSDTPWPLAQCPPARRDGLLSIEAFKLSSCVLATACGLDVDLGGVLELSLFHE